jgi:hypothetical protein
MKNNKALIAMVVSLGLASVGFSQQPYPPAQYPPQQQPPYPQDQQQYPPQGQQPQYPSQYPQQQYPPAQGYPQQQYPVAGPNQPPLLPPQQLDQMVASIALYPDNLLAHVLTAATVYQQIPEAAGWANQHAYLHGGALAAAIQEDHLPWDVSVLALIPFPQVLSQMAQYMQWTEQLGDAVLAQRPDVMDAIQRLRARANQYGYFRDPQFAQYEHVVVEGPVIQIVPVGPDYFVPYYNPRIFFVAPRPGFFVGFSFGPAISIGGFFGAWGWGPGIGFGWREHNILVGGAVWNHGWVDRARFNHPVAWGPEHRYDNHGYVPQRREEVHREEHREEHRDR